MAMKSEPWKSYRTLQGFTLGICVLLFAGTLLNYLDRQVMALTADKIIAQFHLSKEALGRIMGMFRYAYGAGNLVGGYLIDAYGPLLVYPTAGVVWSAGGMLMGLAGSSGLLRGLTAMLGLGEAFNFPCAVKATAALVPAEERPLANGIFNSGAPVGALLAPVIVTLLTVYYSWRAAFVVTGALSVVWVAAWMLYTRKAGNQLRGSPLDKKKAWAATRHILSLSSFWVLAISSVVINGINYYLADWVPLYLKTTRGFSFARGNVLSITVYAGTWTGYIVTGFIVHRLVTSGVPILTAKKWVLALNCVLLGSAIVAGLTPHRYVAVAFLGLTGLGMAGFMTIYMTLAQEIDLEHVGIANGLLAGLGNFAYGFLTPYIGRLADMKESFLILVLIGCLPWAAFLVICVGMREDAAMPEPTAPLAAGGK